MHLTWLDMKYVKIVQCHTAGSLDIMFCNHVMIILQKILKTKSILWCIVNILITYILFVTDKPCMSPML